VLVEVQKVERMDSVEVHPPEVIVVAAVTAVTVNYTDKVAALDLELVGTVGAVVARKELVAVVEAAPRMDLHLEVNDMSSGVEATGRGFVEREEPAGEVELLATERLWSDKSSLGQELAVLGVTASRSGV
jgi:hypothetical protein